MPGEGNRSLRAGSLQENDDGARASELFADAPDAWVAVRPGVFVMFFPEDAHMTVMADGPLHKIIVSGSVV
ncbi:MAG: hypothetical protein OHK006_17920 [Thermodesulfovibrionales bacterium]